MSEGQVYDFECILIALFAGAFFLVLIMRWLRRMQPGLSIGNAIATAFVFRVVVAFGLSLTPIARELRGGDELTFLSKAVSLSRWNLASTGSIDGLTHNLHSFFFSLNYRIFTQVPETMLRVEVIAFAVAGIALLCAAVHELAGRRPAVITAWLLAFEPTNVFFSGILHKEPFMLLAEGLVAFGGAVLWKRGEYRALVPIVLGCLIATATRPYVGWFLAAASAAVMLHASLRRSSASRSLVLAVVVIGLAVAFVPTVWNVSSKKSLHTLQLSQDANASDPKANLSLERVDYSSREKVVLNLPKRVLDIVTKPYPWQLQNTSQQLGVIGTTFLFVGLFLLAGALLQNGRAIMRRAGPLVYPALFLLAAYSLSAGNAGTAFRYRTHLVAFLAAVLVVLRAQRQEDQAALRASPLRRADPIVAGGLAAPDSVHTLAT
jgi:hypothetical protein